MSTCLSTLGISPTMCGPFKELKTARANVWNIVSRLASTGELAGMDMLCSNKTGTRTQSIMTIESRLPWCETLKQGLCCCCLHCWQRSGAVHDRLYWSCVRSRTASVTVQFCRSLVHVFVILDCNSLHICRICFWSSVHLLHGSSHQILSAVSHGKKSVYRMGHQAAYAQFRVLRNRTSTVISLLRRAIKIHSTGVEVAKRYCHASSQ